MAYYLGIDGGGTKTTCAIGDESRILGLVTAGPSNPVRVGEERARASLHECVRQACAGAGIVPAQLTQSCIGVSGAARPEMAGKIRNILAEVISTPIEVVGDMEIALEAAVETGVGVIVIAGTGSIGYGRNRQGTAARAGGWGFAIGDEGSAHWIGRNAVSAVLRAWDEAAPQSRASIESLPLVVSLRSAWKASSLSELARTANSVPPPDFAALFPAVAGDDGEIAAKILRRAGEELARLAAMVVAHLFALEQTDVPVGMIGGVFRHSRLVREVFYNELGSRDPRARIQPEVVEPVEGALRRARRGATVTAPTSRP